MVSNAEANVTDSLTLLLKTAKAEFCIYTLEGDLEQVDDICIIGIRV